MLQQRAITALASLPRPLNAAQLVFLALYPCRHSFATLGLAAGAEVYWVSKQLGHADIRTTLKHYARFLPAVDERNLQLLDGFEAPAAGRASDSRHGEDG